MGTSDEVVIALDAVVDALVARVGERLDDGEVTLGGRENGWTVQIEGTYRGAGLSLVASADSLFAAIVKVTMLLMDSGVLEGRSDSLVALVEGLREQRGIGFRRGAGAVLSRSARLVESGSHPPSTAHRLRQRRGRRLLAAYWTRRMPFEST